MILRVWYLQDAEVDHILDYARPSDISRGITAARSGFKNAWSLVRTVDTRAK